MLDHVTKLEFFERLANAAIAYHERAGDNADVQGLLEAVLVKAGSIATEISDGTIVPGPKAPDGAPNVLIVLIDDAGFGGPETFGAAIRTPTLTRVAQEGLIYNRFHDTAVCSPTRAALLTGRNHHRRGGSTT